MIVYKKLKSHHSFKLINVSTADVAVEQLLHDSASSHQFSGGQGGGTTGGTHGEVARLRTVCILEDEAATLSVLDAVKGIYKQAEKHNSNHCITDSLTQ